MTQGQLNAFYCQLNNAETQWYTFFEDTPDEQSILVPGCSFKIELDEIYRGIITLPNGEELVVQDETEAPLPDKMQRAAITKLLQSDDALQFCASLIAGRMLEADEECDISINNDTLNFVRSNLELEMTNKTLTIKQNGFVCTDIEIENTPASLSSVCSALLDISMPAMAFIGQEELVENIKERYPDFADHISKQIDYLHDNSVSYHITVPSPSDEKRYLWIIIQQYDVTVGMNDNSLCDDIGLHIDAVSKYVNAIIEEKTVLVAEYKDEKAFDNGNIRQITWADAPKNAQELEDKYAKKSKGLGKIANKGKIIDIFSWNGTYSMTLKL